MVIILSEKNNMHHMVRQQGMVDDIFHKIMDQKRRDANQLDYGINLVGNRKSARMLKGRYPQIAFNQIQLLCKKIQILSVSEHITEIL